MASAQQEAFVVRRVFVSDHFNEPNLLTLILFFLVVPDGDRELVVLNVRIDPLDHQAILFRFASKNNRPRYTNR